MTQAVVLQTCSVLLLNRIPPAIVLSHAPLKFAITRAAVIFKSDTIVAYVAAALLELKYVELATVDVK